MEGIKLSLHIKSLSFKQQISMSTIISKNEQLVHPFYHTICVIEVAKERGSMMLSLNHLSPILQSEMDLFCLPLIFFLFVCFYCLLLRLHGKTIRNNDLPNEVDSI